MTAEFGGASSMFAYAYWRHGSTDAVPEYICTSPTFESRDGEYRHRFIRGDTFLSSYDKFTDDLDVIENAVLSMIGNGLSLNISTYPHISSKTITTWCSDLRIQVKTFTIALVLDLWRFSRGILMNHTNSKYVSLIANIADTHPDLLDVDPTRTCTGNELISLCTRGNEDVYDVQCGQKLVPMYKREVMQPFDYNLAVWRELAITKLASDLSLNFISPSFAFYGQWTYIEDAGVDLFENSAMHQRYSRGITAEDITSSLRDARSTITDSIEYPTYHTGELSARVYDNIEYAQSYLLMSPVAMMHTMEHVGWPMQSLPDFVRRIPSQRPQVINSFADPNLAAKQFFELAYAAHCIHTKLGVAHTDLHTNNMTFYPWGLANCSTPEDGKDVYTPFYKDPVAAYVLGPRGEADTYIFPANGTSACIIDYSRAIIGPAFNHRLESERSPRYALNFYRDQVNRAMRALHRYAPEYVTKNQNALKGEMIANFELIFPALCAVDFIAIGKNLGAMLKLAAVPVDGELRQFIVCPEAFEIATALERYGREALITGLHGVINRSKGVTTDLTIMPGKAIIDRIFGEWTYVNWVRKNPKNVHDTQLVDGYNINNKVQYDGSDYTRYPPWAKIDNIEPQLGKYKMTDLFERGVEPFLSALNPGDQVEVIDAKVSAEQEKLDGKPVSHLSSWIDE